MNSNIVFPHPVLVLESIASYLVLCIFLNLQFWMIYNKERRMHVIFFFLSFGSLVGSLVL